MEELETKKYAGIDLGRTSVQFSIYREGQEEMTEESFLLSEEEQKEYIESGMRQVERYMETGGLRWPDFQAVHFSMEDASEENRSKLKSAVSEELRKLHGVKVITHFRAFTGSGFEGNWMKKTLTYLCAGRRVFLGQNLYANGACLLGIHSIELMDEGMILMDGPDMVYHTVGVVTTEAGKPQYVPITSIGREWYNTHGSVDIILDKSQRVDFFYHNTKENEIEGAACDIKGLPKRPPKTTRIRIEVSFTSQTEGVILLKDMGFGEMFPATGKIIVFPFTLIS